MTYPLEDLGRRFRFNETMLGRDLRPSRARSLHGREVLIRTLPGYYLAGNLYRPRSGTGPYPGVLQAHGHWSPSQRRHARRTRK